MRIPVLTVLLLLLCGCTSTTSVFMLDCALDDHMGDAGLKLVYRGTEDYFHYLDLHYNGKRKKYRVSQFALDVRRPFPLDSDRRDIYWITLEAYGADRIEIMEDQRWVLTPVQGDAGELYKLELAPKDKKRHPESRNRP